MKFGKYLESKQLELPEYLGYFINYKALKKLIKQLATIHSPHSGASPDVDFASHHIEKLLQDNKSTFFFRVERELEKVNEFYIEKQADLKLKLDILVNKKLQLLKYSSSSSSRHSSSSSWDKNSSITFQTLYANFKQFTNKLDQLSQFVELNETGFRKILKKWDKRSKSHLKEIYLSTTVNVQPVFHREEINHLNDLVANSILELEAYADGENVVAFSNNTNTNTTANTNPNDDSNTDKGLDGDNVRPNMVDDDRQTDELYSKFLNIATAPHNQLILLSNWLNKLKDFKSSDKLTKVFFLALSAPIEDIYLINFYNYFKQYIDLQFVDYYTNKNFLHQIASTSFRKFQKISNLRNKDTRSSSIIKLQRLDETQIPNNLVVDDDKGNPNDNKDSSQSNNALAEENSFSRFFLIKTLLVDDTSDEFSQLLTIKDNNSKTPLHYAAEFGRFDLLKLLVDKNPQNLHTLDNRTMTPLLLAIKHNHLNCVKYLLLKENEIANQKPQSSESFKNLNPLAAANITPGFSPLNYACKYGNYEIIKTLLDYSNIIDKTAQNVEGLLPLHMAARSGHFKVIELLVTYGKLNPNCLCSLHNWTPIFYAAVHGHSRTTRELIKYGAVPDIVDEKNYTPIYYAAYSGHVNVLNTLFHSINFANSNVPLTIKNLLKKDKKSINTSNTNNSSLFGNFSNFNNNTPNVNSSSSVNVNNNHNSNTSTPTNISSMFKSISRKISNDVGLESSQHHFSPSQDTNINHNNNSSNTNNNNNNNNNNSNNSNGVSASVSVPSTESNLLNSTSEHLTDNINLDAIPTLSLPPPIIPLRKYGHNFLEKKTSLQISFFPGKSSIKLFNYHNNNRKHARAVARGATSSNTIFNTDTFGNHTTYNDSHRDIQKVDLDDSDYGQTLDESDTPLFPGRITITSSNSDIVPRNLLLPIDEKDNFVNFQIDELTKDFSMEYELFPTFGTKLIAKTTALANVFLNNEGGGNGNMGNSFLNDDSGIVTLPLFDTRLKNIGSLTFKFQIIYSYCGAPLEITKYETYWKSTNNDQQGSAANAVSDNENNINNNHSYTGSTGGSLTDSSSKFTSMLSFVAASSLSGDYLKVNICMLNDGTPIICPRSFIELDSCGIKLSLLNLSSSELFAITSTHTQLGDIEKKLHDLSNDYHCMVDAFANAGDGGSGILSFGDSSGIGNPQEQLNLVKKKFLKRASEILSNLYLPLDLLLQYLPKEISVNFDIFYPTKFELKHFFKVLSVNNDSNNRYTSANNISNGTSLNGFIDRILSVVFNHIRSSNQQDNNNIGDNTITNSSYTNSDNKKRSIVFSSYNPIVCKVLNWKQPNFPVFFAMGGTRFNYGKNNFELNSANGFNLIGCGSVSGSSSGSHAIISGSVADAAISSPSVDGATASSIDGHSNNNILNDNSGNKTAVDSNRTEINIGNPENTFDDANDSEYYNTIKQNDEESCTRSIEAAIRFATVNNFIGIIVPIKLLLLVPDLSKTIRSRGLILVGSKEDPKNFNDHFMHGGPGSARAAITGSGNATVDAGVNIDVDVDVEGQQRRNTVGVISKTIKDFEDIEIKDYSKSTSINGVRINNLLEFQGSIDM